MDRDQLGAVVGVSGAVVRRYETGTMTPSTRTLARLCAAIGCTVADVYDPSGTDDPVAAYDRDLADTVASMPPLTPGQRQHLAVLLAPP